MKKLEYIRKHEIQHPIFKVKGTGSNGVFQIPSPCQSTVAMLIISSDGNGWDHVSVSIKHRIPNWEEMSFVKDLFFKENETAMQLHPKKSNYVNVHKNCLHLWRDQENEIKLPPEIMV